VKTLEVSTRCGQDSDCNPSNAMAVLGVIKGLTGLPAEMQEAVASIGDSLFINTTYSFNTAVSSTYDYALELIRADGGKIRGDKINIQTQLPVPPPLKVSFPNTVFDRKIPVFEKGPWSFKGGWKAYEVTGNDNRVRKQSLYAEKKGDELELSFSGTGVSLTGNWYKDGGKADIYVDGIFHRTIDTYYYFAGQQHTESIWHIMNLEPGNHTVKIVVRGEKRPESEGTRVYITSATIFKTEPKKNENFRFSFEN